MVIGALERLLVRPIALILALLLVMPGQAFATSMVPLKLVADGLDQPSNLALAPDGSGRIFVTERETGRIRVIEHGRLLQDSFLDLHDRIIDDPTFEEGLIGLAFSPHFPASPYLFVTYVSRNGDLVLSRFEVAPSGREAIATTERELLHIPRDNRMHHCGHIEFGPHDGRLYLCVGDTQNNREIAPVAQDPARPQGKILRLEVEPGGSPVAQVQPSVAVTSSAVAAATAGGDYEIRALGLRNPWHFAMDPLNGDLVIPDVGRHHWEEINVRRGSDPEPANFGWPLAEGNDCLESCGTASLSWPVYEYPQRDGRCAIIGGSIYRGPGLPEWQGAFVFGDMCSGEIWALRDLHGEPELRKIAETDLMPMAIQAGRDGAFLIADSRGGAIWRLALSDVGDGDWVPANRAMWTIVNDARRNGFSRSNELVERVFRSRSWRWSRPFRHAVAFIREIFY